eukprot:TRINITY_DN61717_c0_g1_i1.p1 TRINITY_DN61717_c0_g1~~TRINITY_DN61717_c0_g1_i1.p1  ORF type:complete len:252 (+),score=48.78 TRINITY_DN61717_c0_g1_i1:121-876(+)
MHKHKDACRCAAGDEVFVASDSESEVEESDCESVDSDTPTAASPVRPTQKQNVPDKIMPNKIVPLPVAQAAASAAATRCCGAVAAAATRSPPLQGSGEAQSGAGLMGLVSHLRNDNARLREALVQAQRDLEAKAAEGGKESSIDFGHLLSLVKDFGDDLGHLGSFYGDDCHEADRASCNVEVFAISSPREDDGDNDDCRKVCDLQIGPSDEVVLLRSELQTCRQEIEQLHSDLAAKDAELMELRKHAVCIA